jgi:hypothetical protein
MGAGAAGSVRATEALTTADLDARRAPLASAGARSMRPGPKAAVGRNGPLKNRPSIFIIISFI